MSTLSCKSRTALSALLCLALLAWAGTAVAQLPMPSSTQFDINGFLQDAKLDGSGTGAHQGGHLTVNGQVITVPAETIVILPANALTWAELFTQAPGPYGPTQTGMAMNDSPAPITTYEVHVVGNRVLGGPGGADIYIAGLINIAQNGLNSGAGFINYMNYNTGEMEVGGALNTPNTGTKIQLNDPSGRYGRKVSPDPRFTVDPDNPTIASATGFPMCFPRATPPPNGPGDPLCPESQRPLAAQGYAATIQMQDPVNAPGASPDPTIQAPFEVGDYVTFAGTLEPDGKGGTYVSAHTIINNVAIFTWPGTNPAYVSTEVALIGTGGLTVAGAGEAAIRTRFEGMTTDPSRNVHLYGIDLNPGDGSTSDRDWGTIGVDPGPPNGAVKGRWRFRPPCTAAVATDKACTPPPGGTFLPPTREVRAVIEGAFKAPITPQSPTAANGIVFGQYHAPIQEYIFPENIPGTPIVPNNFNAMDFLAQGGYMSSTGTLAGQLNPWPDSTTPTPACTAPVPNAGGPYTVAFGGTVPLNGSATGTAPITFLWTNANNDGVLTNPTSPNATWTATCGPGVSCLPGTPHTLTLTATNSCGSASTTATVTIDQATAPTVAPIAPVSVFSSANGSFTVNATDPGNLLPLTFTATQAGAPALLNLTVTQASPTSATVSFTAPTLPANQTTTSTVTVSVTATNTAGAQSAPGSVTVTIKPLTDAVAITNVDYRTGKQRLTITATSSSDPNATLTLNPYLTQNGTTFNPATIGNVFTNLGAGAGYQIILVGAPAPACNPPNPGGALATPCSQTPLTVKSNLGGVSPPHAIDRIRQ
jgi:hypothetical protein